MAGLKEEDLSNDTGSSRTTGSAAVSSVNLSDIPDRTLGEWLCKHTMITSVIIMIMISSYDNNNYCVMITNYSFFMHSSASSFCQAII